MIEIRFSGRGGQGVVVASQILGLAFFKAGKYPQCYSIFAGERRGAPLVSFLRVGEQKIRLKCEILKADELICLDDSLVQADEVATFLRPGGSILINSQRPLESFEGLDDYKAASVDAKRISNEAGLKGIINTAVIGAYWGFSGQTDLDPLLNAVREMVPVKKDENDKAVRLSFSHIIQGMRS